MFTRRHLIKTSSIFVMPLGVAGCATAPVPVVNTSPRPPRPAEDDVHRYSAQPGEKYPVEAVDMEIIDPHYLRRLVDYASNEPPGTVIVDTPHRYVYLLLEHGKALRYGVGVGREGLEFKGVGTIAYKREWPRWTPTRDMIKRQPELYLQWKDGMAGGPRNPLGARALYLFKDGRDTLFRIHGTTEPESIGKAVSSGCIRMINQDVIDFYSRVPANTKVVVLQNT